MYLLLFYFLVFIAIDRSGLFMLTVLCSRGFFLFFFRVSSHSILAGWGDKGRDLSDESERWDA